LELIMVAAQVAATMIGKNLKSSWQE